MLSIIALALGGWQSLKFLPIRSALPYFEKDVLARSFISTIMPFMSQTVTAAGNSFTHSWGWYFLAVNGTPGTGMLRRGKRVGGGMRGRPPWGALGKMKKGRA